MAVLEEATSRETLLPPPEGALLDRIDSRRAVVGVVGLGYVGLPLLLTFAERSFPVIGFDIDERKIEAIGRGESYLRHIDAGRIKAQLAGGDDRFVATADFQRASDADALLMCVPTPLTHAREPDLSYVENTCRSIGPHLRHGQLVVLESST